jgi:hypothetical protein
MQQGLQCLERHSGKSERDAFLACVPFSKPERVSGAWAYGFEINEFYEGERADRLKRGASDTALDLEAEVGVNGRPRVYQVDFIGRRSQCDMGLPSHVLLVDRVISKRSVGQPD